MNVAEYSEKTKKFEDRRNKILSAIEANGWTQPVAKEAYALKKDIDTFNYEYEKPVKYSTY